ncbi:MAG: accB [Gammaproteobacteria bacterium]|jgi:acetyl-CoA carboxylase biotin carboxyl carrier protein|nr:accB [Gammaproteobacteria bacterium]
MKKIQIDKTKLLELVSFIKENDLAEIEIKQGDQSVRIARYGTAPIPQASVTTASGAAKNEDHPILTGHPINSPMVGIAYLAPSPEAKAFVQVGDHVKKGQTLCIIEAMKMMNQIEADRTGVVKARLIENAQPVEFGQALFVIE